MVEGLPKEIVKQELSLSAFYLIFYYFPDFLNPKQKDLVSVSEGATR